jgi:hypothetical protein
MFILFSPMCSNVQVAPPRPICVLIYDAVVLLCCLQRPFLFQVELSSYFAESSHVHLVGQLCWRYVFVRALIWMRASEAVEMGFRGYLTGG